MSEDLDPECVFSLLDDECAKEILVATTDEPMTAETLTNHCEASPSTVYRIDRLERCGLLAEATDVDLDGTHRGVYRARMERLIIDLSENGFDVDMDAHIADLFTDLWEGIR